MKKWIVLLVCCILLGCTAAAAEDYKAILTGNDWVTIDNSMDMHFMPDGTGYFSFAMGKYDTVWTLEENTVTANYELYGSHAFVLNLSQTAEGWRLASSDGTATFFSAGSLNAVKESQKDDWGYTLKKGEAIQLPFVEISLDSIAQQGYVGFTKEDGTAGAVFTPGLGNTFVAFAGTIKNTGNQEISVTNIKAEYVFNDNMTYPATCYVVSADKCDYRVTAHNQAAFYIAASVPQNLIKELNSCTVIFSFNTNLLVAPGTAREGDFLFNRVVDEEEFAPVKKSAERTKHYFEESPALPLPSSYVDVRSRGMSRTGSKGNYKTIVYYFSPLELSGSDEDLVLTYMKGLLLDGYIVTGKGDPYIVSIGSTKLATVTTDMGLKIDVTPGNENLKRSGSGKAAVATVEKEPDNRIKKASVGSTINANTSKLQLLSVKKADKLITSETARRYYYYEPNLPNTNRHSGQARHK